MPDSLGAVPGDMAGVLLAQAIGHPRAAPQPAWKHNLQSTRGHLTAPWAQAVAQWPPQCQEEVACPCTAGKAEHRDCRGAFPALGQHTHAAVGQRDTASAVLPRAGTGVHTVPGTTLSPVAHHELV